MAEPAAAGAAQGSGIPHIANWLSWLSQSIGTETALGHFIHQYEDLLFAAFIAGFLCVLCWAASRNPKMVPTGVQNFVEILIEGLNKFIAGVMGEKNAKTFAPVIGTLFLYIWMMNLAGLVPGMKSPTANINTTAGLALCVFFFIHITGLRSLGIKGYISHMMGEPKGLMMVVIGLLIMVIHLVGELVKPVSLAMRLGFNITGEDTFLAVAVGFGPLGLLLQLMAIALGLILSTAQALVFATLSAVFISMMLPHHEEHPVSETSSHEEV